jgi:hypothetical protein
MDNDNIKSQLINSYLAHQLNADQPSNSSTALQTIDVPNSDELARFKENVRFYIEIDDNIKKLKAQIAEHNAAKTLLSNHILQFMCKFSIDDINVNNSKLKYRVSTVKSPLTQNTIKSKFIENYDNSLSAEEMAKKIFEERKTTEKHTLRRSQRG